MDREGPYDARHSVHFWMIWRGGNRAVLYYGENRPLTRRDKTALVTLPPGGADILAGGRFFPTSGNFPLFSQAYLACLATLPSPSQDTQVWAW